MVKDKPRSPEDIDTIVSAELPDRELFSELFETIVACMLHGPCGLQNTKSACMKEGRCSKGYPNQLPKLQQCQMISIQSTNDLKMDVLQKEEDMSSIIEMLFPTIHIFVSSTIVISMLR